MLTLRTLDATAPYSRMSYVCANIYWQLYLLSFMSCTILVCWAQFITIWPSL